MALHHFDTNATIIAPATASGGAVVMVRISGPEAISITDSIFRGRKKLSDAKGYTLHYGDIVYDNGNVLDDVVVALFRAPHSYTGEDSVEVNLHGSEYIVSEFLRLAIEHGAMMATPGEFTQRAFLAGKMDLSRAEAVADIIASDSQWSHNVASTQMRGTYSERLGAMRESLLRLCSLLELELDFSEEDVEFANRDELRNMLENINSEVAQLKSSFALGNVLKNGVTVAIVGEPNVGKSTLLNALVEDDRAMVSDIAGTTRDTIEATTIIDGICYRFVDTAGLRTTADQLEQMGIDRTYRAMENAQIILHITTAENPSFEEISILPHQKYIQVVNKIDKITSIDTQTADSPLQISAKCNIGIDSLRTALRKCTDTSHLNSSSVVVTNMRHYAALEKASESLEAALTAMDNNLPSDLLSEDIRQTLHHLGEITGDITSDDILQTIFSKFCIGK
ncbi:MAG: tRNA uridine-5-carboxymethylaminomethyl(34) synthesis GTPase MnmE [Alistipes sp.]|nr:tRNA uridine-5-carboxymethylaminomethyl(34) synthesis GTPase MnmE [Alistipes sp.]